jgi:LCP family protein required for cell wall assembly
LGVDSGGRDIRDFENLRGRRSDAMMLVNISGDRSEVTLVSLMRDLWVDIPGHRTDKLNAAVSLGGVPMAVAAVEQLLDVRVDHVIVSDFDGLIGLTDSFGGVDIVNPQRFRSWHMPGKIFEAGPQRMTGEELLAFTQERFAFRDGDYTRVQNQRLALQALAKALAKSIRPLSPWEVPATIKQVGQFVAIDKGLNLATMVSLALDFNSQDPQVATLTLPTLGTGTTPGGQSIVIPDYAGIKQVSEALKEDSIYAWRQLVN